MTAELSLPALLDALEKRGVEIRLDGANVRVNGWKKVSPEERERLREQREQLIELLRADSETLAPPAPVKTFGVWKPRDERHRRFRERGTLLTEKGEEFMGAILEDVPEEDMTSAEIMIARRQFARRFGLPFDNPY